MRYSPSASYVQPTHQSQAAYIAYGPSTSAGGQASYPGRSTASAQEFELAPGERLVSIDSVKYSTPASSASRVNTTPRVSVSRSAPRLSEPPKLAVDKTPNTPAPPSAVIGQVASNPKPPTSNRRRTAPPRIDFEEKPRRSGFESLRELTELKGFEVDGFDISLFRLLVEDVKPAEAKLGGETLSLVKVKGKYFYLYGDKKGFPELAQSGKVFTNKKEGGFSLLFVNGDGKLYFLPVTKAEVGENSYSFALNDGSRVEFAVAYGKIQAVNYFN